MERWGKGVAVVIALAAGPAWAAEREAQPQNTIQQAVRTIRAVPEGGARYEYRMTGAVRLGLFWVSRENVGQGTIRVGRDAAGKEFIRLVIGSDPDKAPMRINRWGLATEVLDTASVESVFFGLMKPSGNGSLATARREAAQGEPRFQALIGSNRPGSAVSVGKSVPMPREFTVKEAAAVEAAALSHLEQDSNPRVVNGQPGQCDRCPGFLFSVRELIGEAIARQATPARRCYRYNGKVLTATLVRSERAGERRIGALVYRDLRRAQFEVEDHTSGDRSSFELLVGTRGALEGVPVAIEYRPNWWLKLALTLVPESRAWERAANARN